MRRSSIKPLSLTGYFISPFSLRRTRCSAGAAWVLPHARHSFVAGMWRLTENARDRLPLFLLENGRNNGKCSQTIGIKGILQPARRQTEKEAAFAMNKIFFTRGKKLP